MAGTTLSFNERDALDNPVWSALSTVHSSLAEGGSQARRYPAKIAPFAAFPSDEATAAPELRVLATNGPIAVLTHAPLLPIDGLEVGLRSTLRQMIASQDASTYATTDDVSRRFVPLGLNDVKEMLELTALTKPGPFFSRTYELGLYIGLREAGRLVAMAGERMRFEGYTEISAVCVHPDFRGRGYGEQLVRAMATVICGRGDKPFLHVFQSNSGAVALYERLGFEPRRTLHVTQLR